MTTRLDHPSYDAVRGVVERYSLHAEPLTLPISPRQIARDEGWEMRFAEGMGGVYGVAAVYHGMKVMTINADISPGIQRGVIAHELGHVLCRHDLTLDFVLPRTRYADFANWIDQRQEREAWLVAAILLIPDQLVLSGYSAEELAALCHCSTSLAEVRLAGLAHGDVRILPHVYPRRVERITAFGSTHIVPAVGE